MKRHSVIGATAPINTRQPVMCSTEDNADIMPATDKIRDNYGVEMVGSPRPWRVSCKAASRHRNKIIAGLHTAQGNRKIFAADLKQHPRTSHISAIVLFGHHNGIWQDMRNTWCLHLSKLCLQQHVA